MNTILKYYVKQLSSFSKSLEKKALFVDKPWAMIDEEFEMQKLIFKNNQELIMSKNGKVQMGRWEYLAEARCLLIDRGKDKILCQEGFIEEGVLILKLDGTEGRFFALANENIIPDL